MTKMSASLDMPIDIRYINGLSNVLHGLFALLILGCITQYIVKYKINSLNSVVIKGDVTHNDITSIRNRMNLNLTGNFYNIDLIKAKKTFESITWVNKAIVKRVYPNHIEVKLSEFKPKAIWGNREDLKLVDDLGVVFDINAEESEYEQMPQFIGSDGQSKVMLEMYKSLSIALIPLQYKLKILELNARGSWIVILESGAHIELGRGNVLNVIERANKFANGIKQILEKLNKKIIDIKYVDLRHSDGYAIRMHGVSTLDLTTVNTSIKK